MAKKKQKTVFSYKEYKENNGTTVSFGDYKKQQEQQRKIREQQESMAAVKEKNRLKRQEQKKRQESLARTKAWQEAYNDAKNAGGEDKSWQVYAAKMISDTPGALEKEQERERKRQEEIARKKRIALQSNYGTPTKGPALKNELTEKYELGPYKTQQNALNSYIGALKESKAAKEKSYPTLSGQKPQGPIDKQETVFSRFLTNLNKKQQERNQSIQGGREGYKAATGMITNNGQQQFGVRTFNDFAQLMQRRGAKGELNNSGIPLFMNEEGRAAFREAAEQKQTKADTMRSDFVKNRDAWSPEQKWESVFDMLEDRAEKNEERILRGSYTPEQQAVAGRKLSNLQGTRESRRQDVMDRAKDFFQFQYKKEEWENIDDENPDFMSSQDRRELLYDQIMPDTYAERTARMTAEEKAQLDSLIDAVFEDAAGTELDWFKNEDEYKRLIRESNSELQEANKVEQYQRDYDYFTNWANEYGTEGSPFKGGPLDGSYDPSLVQTQETLKGGKYSVTITEPTGSRTDKAYYYMNNVPELGAYGNVSGTEQKEYFATPEMVDTFNKLYKHDRETGSNMAEQFLDGIDYYLTSCLNLYHEYDVRRLSEDPVFGITARAGSYIANAAMAPVNLINTGLAMLGNKDAADPNNTINRINRDIQTLRENQNEVADEAIAQLIPFMKGKTNFLLNVGDSIIDNVVAMGAAKMLAPGMTSNEASQKLGMRLVQLIMSGEATGHTFVQKLDQGMDAGEAAMYAIGDGIIEWFTERVSLEALLKPDVRAMLGNPKELLKFIGKTTLAEGSEEIAADLLNWGLDYIMSMAYEHKTELESRRDELIASGMDKDKAWQQALTEKFEQIGLSGLAGGISGGVMGIGRIGMNTVNQVRTGSMTKNTQVNGLTGTEGLLEIAKEMNGEMSVKQAEAIQQKIDNGQEVSSKELGKLAQTIQMETSEKLNNPGGVTINEYITGMDTLKSVAEYTGQVKAEENRNSSFWAKPDEISELEQKGKGRIQGNREAIWYDEKTGDGRFVNIDNVKVTQDRDDGNKWKLKLTVTVDGKQQDVNASDLKMTDYKTAKILYMASTKPEYFSGEFTKTLLDAAEKGQFSDDNRMMDRQLRDAQLIRLYAYAGQETDSLKLASLDRDTQNRIWLQSADEHRQNRQQQVKDAGAQRSSKITYRGAEYGTKAWNDVVKEMPKNMRAQMDVIAAVAQKAGVSVDFEDLSDEKLYGWENKNDKKIGINVNGINFDTITGESSGRHHMLVTFGHEFTHWMMQHSMAGYNRLEQYVLKSYMKERGAVGLQNVIESYRMGEDHLNLEDAIAEIVAEASDSVLMDENVVRHIQESDNKLYTEIKKFATDLVGRLKEAIGLMPDSQSSIRRVLANYANEINRLWTGAFDEALSGYITEDKGSKLTPEEYQQMVAEETDTQRFSRAETFEAAQEKYNGKDLINDETLYNYNFLVSMPNIKVQTEIKSNRYTDNKGNIDRTKLEKIAMDNAKFVGRELSKNRGVAVKNNYTGREIIITPDGAMHGTTYLSKSVIIRNARATARIGNLAKIAIPLNVMTDEKQQHNGTYAMAAPMVSMDGKHSSIAVLVVDELTGNVLNTEVYDQVHSVSVREKNEAGLEAETASPSSQFLNGDTGVTRSNISIKELLDVVNSTHKGLLSRDVLRHFGEVKPDKGYWAENTRYSRAQLDNEYMAAVESGDEINQIRYVEEAARRAGYKDLAYHGTKMFGFTNFDMIAGQGMAFVAYNERLAKSYTTAGELRNISSRTGIPVNFYTLNDSELGEYVKDIFNRWGMMGVTSVRKIEGGENKSDVDLFEVKHKNDWEKNETTSKYRRFELYQALEEYTNPNAELDGIYQLYTKPKNQLVIDAEGKLWNEIPFDLYGVKVSGNIDEETYEYTDTEWDEDFDPDIPHDVTANTREIAKWAKAHGYDSVRINNVSDNGGRNIELYNEGAEQVYGDIGIFFNENDIKSADPIVYDDNGDVIPLSERFNDQKTDIRWSRAQAELTAEQQETVDEAEENGIALDINNHTASSYFSRASFERSEYFKDPEKMARMLAKNVLGSESKANIAKATKWIKDVTSISALIAERPEIRDYFASPGRSSFKSNPEYGGSIDSSTICAKRRLQTGTLDAIQRALPDYAMTAEDFLRVRRMMKEKGYEVSCGLCFVESSRKNIAKYAKQFMNEWNSQHPENQVNMVQINTVLGLEDTRINRKEVYDAYEKFMNKLAQRKPKLFEMRSEYDNDIIKHFKKDESVEAKNRNGGMRINSFSDFEIVHLIDMMQVIMDMSNVGLAGQAYTKVKEFVQALGPTGLKINMSMIAAGVDENGKIIFDEIEGMKWDDVKDLRDKYADNVGTVCVVFTEDQLFAAMADDRIDFIIPFHRSQWNKSNYADIGLPENVKDFTYWQNERYRTPVFGTKKDGSPKKLRATNYMPNEYWNPELSGKENAEAYLRMCYENNKIPKFWKWLQSNGDGSFSLKADGSTDGYWKLLGDFKMYNHLTGEYAPQMPVKPEFDMEQSRRMLEEYKGGHESFPEASDVVQEFVKEKKQGRKGLSTGKNGRIQLAGNEIENRMSRWTESAMDVNYWMEHVTPSALQTEDEWKMVQAYRGKRTSMALSLKKQLDMKAQIRQLEGKADLTTEDRNALIKLRTNLKTEQDKYDRLENEIAEITSDSGWAGIMRQHNVVFRDYMEGKTQEQVQAAIDSLTEEVKRSDKEIARQEKALAKMEEESAVQTVKKLLARKGLARTVNALRSEYFTSMSEEELKNRLAEIVIKNANGEDITADVEALAADVVTNQTGAASDVADEQLYPLRGMTIELSPAQMKELKAKGSSLAEIRRKTKGSGIRFVEGEKFTLESNIQDIIDENPSMRDKLENAGNSLDNFVDYVEGLLKLKQQNAAENIDQTELEAFITASANIMLNENAGGMNKTELIEAIRKEAGRIGQALQAVREVKGSMEGMKAAGQKAQTWAGVLNEDTQQALKYYNKMARLAAETERKRVKQNVIESLKSDHAKAMLQQAEKFREQMANDKKARELAEDNAALRSKISTVSTRMANRIFAETDKDNVPEEAKALVRQVLDMVSAHDNFFRKVTYWDKQKVENVRGRLQRMIAHYGKFDADNDLDWLVVKTADPADNDYTAQEKVMQDLIDIETGLMEYRNAEGQGRISLADRKAALTKVQEALSEIWNVVKARSEMEIAGRKWQVIEMAEWMRDEMGRSRFKGERTGFGSKARDTISGGVTWGNLTPEYFFKNLKNKAMDMLHKGLKIAEDRSGLEAAKAKVRLAEIAEKNHFASWDGQEKHTVRTRNGDITMTTEQVMALYATWLREKNQMRPADTAHLLNGGFVLAQKEENKGKPGREKNETRPIRISEDQLQALSGLLTDEQKQYVEDMVAYMSGELAELGNEASMKMYGIKKFTEEYYFPIKSWGGVLNRRSDAGVNASNENRAAQQGFSKRVKNNASNAIEIGEFTPTAIKHVAGMITYNTVGPAIENMNKVLNQQLTYGEIKYTEDGAEEDNTYKMNLRAAFTNAYGKQAGDYLVKFMKDMNGGVTTERNVWDKLLSMFKKNAVAGSLSVAAQQPLSYIRAAMMINPKYLAQAISPQYWKGSYAEMMKHSGVAVIKEMGKFDMNYGQTMQEWITPEGMESRAKKAWNKTTDLVTGLPGAMDMMTWTRMWTAVKLEQMAENRDMDYQSDEFMAKVAERFNDLMRQTQVYDSVMTKSQNMRSTHPFAKTITSFMAEPTLSMNVLADAFQNIKEKGGKAKAIKAVATFLLSAAAQAGAKAFFGAGRTPDKKKNREENFYNKFLYNLLSEANPFGLIPGYRQIIETLTNGEFKDDTMGMIAKAGEVLENIWKLATGEIGKKGLYRDLEDSIGQALQLMTKIPAKNIMRDFRAMVNWFSGGTAHGFTGDTYAQRETSAAVLKYQLIDNLMSNDIMGLVNKKLDDAGYKTTNAAYYQRIVDAEKAGNQDAAEQMKEYLILKSDAADPEKAVNEAIRKLYKNDEDLSAEERLAKQKEYGLQAGGSFVTDEYKAGNLTRKDAERMYRAENPNASDKDVLKTFDKIDWEKSGKDGEGYTNYTPLYEAIGNNRVEEIRAAVKHMTDNGYKAEDIKKQLTTKYKQAYLDAKGSEKTKLMDALTKAYKAIGLSAEEALKIINGWKTKKEKK